MVYKSLVKEASYQLILTKLGFRSFITTYGTMAIALKMWPNFLSHRVQITVYRVLHADMELRALV